MPMAAELHLWMNGLFVGVWAKNRTGTSVLRYDESWVRSPEGRALSLSLPFTVDREHRGDAVDFYFDNLLPDSVEVRRKLRRKFRAKSEEPFDLLTEIGQDCVGAVQLLPPDRKPGGWNRIEGDRLADDDVERILASAGSDDPLAEGEADGFRISIAGAQEKTALLRMGGKWFRPHGATPTTHILKLPLGLVGNMRADMTDSVENEWLCREIMAGLGFETAPTEIATFGTKKALVVTRFDRRWQGIAPTAEQKARFKPTGDVWIARLPQEDFCQALGVLSERKYQADGGPTMHDCLRILAAGEDAPHDRETFVRAQLAFWLLAATDGHAKNFSIRHLRGGHFRLTPLYDVLSAWPILDQRTNGIPYPQAKLAMGVRSKNLHYRLRDVRAGHWQTLANSTGPDVWDRLLTMAQSTDGVLDDVARKLPAGFPERVWDRVATGTRKHARQFLKEAASL